MINKTLGVDIIGACRIVVNVAPITGAVNGIGNAKAPRYHGPGTSGSPSKIGSSRLHGGNTQAVVCTSRSGNLRTCRPSPGHRRGDVSRETWYHRAPNVRHAAGQNGGRDWHNSAWLTKP